MRDDEETMMPGQVAALFGVHVRTVGMWAKAGKLPAIRTLGGQRRYRAGDVRALLRKRATLAAPEFHCPGCRMPLVWAVTPKGYRLAVEADTAADGSVVLEGGDGSEPPQIVLIAPDERAGRTDLRHPHPLPCRATPGGAR